MNHGVGRGDRRGRILSDRERLRYTEALVDRAYPSDMRVQAVDGERQQIAAQRLEAVVSFREGGELAGADRREIRWMREEHQPAAAIIVHRSLAHGGAGLKARRPTSA